MIATLTTKARLWPKATAWRSRASSMGAGMETEIGTFLLRQELRPSGAASMKPSAAGLTGEGAGTSSFAGVAFRGLIGMGSPSEGIEGGDKGGQFGTGFDIRGAQFVDVPPEPGGIRKGFAAGQGGVKQYQGRGIGDTGGRVRIIGPGNIGAIQEGEGAKLAALAGAVRFAYQSGHVFERPHVKRPWQEWDKDNIGGDQGGAQRGRIAAARIDHHILILSAGGPHHPQKLIPVSIKAGINGDGGAQILLGAGFEGIRGGALSVTVKQ